MTKFLYHAHEIIKLLFRRCARESLSSLSTDPGEVGVTSFILVETILPNSVFYEVNLTGDD